MQSAVRSPIRQTAAAMRSRFFKVSGYGLPGNESSETPTGSTRFWHWEQIFTGDRDRESIFEQEQLKRNIPFHAFRSNDPRIALALTLEGCIKAAGVRKSKEGFTSLYKVG